MLNSFYIKGLYDLFTYTLELKKGVFIITGPNGFGKTTILRSINAIYDCDFWRFFFLKFDEIRAVLDDDSVIELKREVISKTVLFGDPLEDVNVKLFFHGAGAEEAFDISFQYIARLIRFQTRRDPSNIEEFLDGSYILREDEVLQKAMPVLLKYLHEKRCTFVGAQRLVYGKMDGRGNQIGIAYTIDDVNEQIKRTYLKAHNDFSKTAQTIDGSFITRLSSMIDNVGQIKNDVSASELQQQIDKYRRYHLIEEMNVDVQLPQSYDLIRNLYLSDIKSKLKAMSIYYERLSTFDEFVTGQGLSYKSIELNENGIIVRSDTGDIIPLNKLSSGEQNLMILAFHLVFKSSKGDILLVDEPENSLHMSWLENLLDEYIRIARITGSQIVIATHSPTFIGNKWKMTFDLFENNEGKMESTYVARSNKA